MLHNNANGIHIIHLTADRLHPALELPPRESPPPPGDVIVTSFLLGACVGLLVGLLTRLIW